MAYPQSLQEHLQHNIEWRTKAQLIHPGDCHHGAGWDTFGTQMVLLEMENRELRRMLSVALTPHNWFRRPRPWDKFRG